MRENLHMKASKLTIFTIFAASLCGSASAQTCTTLTVDAIAGGVNAGDFPAGTATVIVAAPAILPSASPNTVSIANNDTYETDADGVITKAPNAGTAAFTFFSAQLPVGAPVIGQKKTPAAGVLTTLNTAPFGAFVGGVVGNRIGHSTDYMVPGRHIYEH